MPAALEYLVPNSPDRRALGGDDEREMRKKEYTKNKKYYHGEQRKWLIQEYDDPVDDNIIVNITQEAVDRTLSFLFPDMPRFQLDLNNDTEEEVWLNKVWLLNGGAYFLSILAQNGALSGHNYVRVLPSDSEFPRIVVLNPTVPITYWRADDVDTVLWYELKWTVGKTEMLQDVIHNRELGIWQIRQFQRKVGFVKWIDSENTAVDWNSDIPPIIAWAHLPNPNEYYGKPEVTDTTIDLNNSINRVASDVGKILRYHASPRTIGTGVSEQEIKRTEINGFWSIENKDAKIYNLEMESDLSSSMNFLTYLTEAYLTLSRVVIMKGSVKDFQRVTNTGIKAVFLDMLAKNQLLRWTYGIGLQKTCDAILFLGQRVSKFVPVVTWSDPLPADPLETANMYLIQQSQGWVDPITISKTLGYEWGTVVKNWASVEDRIWIPKGGGAAQAPTSNSNNSLNDQAG